MANINVKMFGVIRLGSGIKQTSCTASSLEEVFSYVNSISPSGTDPFSFSDSIVFINGERILKKKHTLTDGDEVWLMSPASGG